MTTKKDVLIFTLEYKGYRLHSTFRLQSTTVYMNASSVSQRLGSVYHSSE